MILGDYMCPEHGVFEALLASPLPDATSCPACGSSSSWVPSAVFGKVKLAEATRGKCEKPPGPGFLDTRDLGEGMDHNEWEERRDKQRDERRRQALKELMT